MDLLSSSQCIQCLSFANYYGNAFSGVVTRCYEASLQLFGAVTKPQNKVLCYATMGVMTLLLSISAV